MVADLERAGQRRAVIGVVPWSVGEGEPANRVAPRLILDDEFPNPPGKSAALPVPLVPSGVGIAGIGCERGPDGVGGGT